MTYTNSQFTYNGKTQTFVAFASSLPGVAEFFKIKIPGRTLEFELSGNHSNCWNFRCLTGAFKAVIFND